MGENIVDFLSQTDDKFKTILRFAKVNKDGYRFVKSYVERNGKALCPKAVESVEGFEHLCVEEKKENDYSIFRNVCLDDSIKKVTQEACDRNKKHLAPILFKSRFLYPTFDRELFYFDDEKKDEYSQNYEELSDEIKQRIIFNENFAEKMFYLFKEKIQEYQNKPEYEDDPHENEWGIWLPQTDVMKSYWLQNDKKLGGSALRIIYIRLIVFDRQFDKFQFENWEHSYIFDKWVEMLFE